MITVNNKNYYFLQLCGNCEGMGYLGPNRIRGPIDNVVTKGVKCLKRLFNNTYLSAIYSEPCKAYHKDKQFDNDSEWAFEYDFVKILHNNITDISYKTSLQKRIDTFNDFLYKVKTREEKDHFFTLNLNEYDIDYKSNIHKLSGSNFIKVLEFLKSNGVISQCIVVQSKLSDSSAINNRNEFVNSFLDNIDELAAKYGFIYFTIIDNDVWNTEKPHEQFKQQFISWKEHTKC